MISKKIEKALNAQIKAELESGYLYLSMAAYLQDQGLDGMAQWMKVQAREETGHAMKFFGYLNERGGRCLLDAVAKPKSEWTSTKEVFQDTLKHEQKVTGLIYGLVKLAEDEKDYATGVLLQWYVTEQVEEEDNAQKILQVLDRIKDSGAGIVMLDHQLGERK